MFRLGSVSRFIKDLMMRMMMMMMFSELPSEEEIGWSSRAPSACFGFQICWLVSKSERFK